MTDPKWPVRAVVKAERAEDEAPWWDLLLSCGHTVMSTTPESAKVTGVLCPECSDEIISATEQRR